MKIALAFIKMLPAVIALIPSLESMFPQSGNGKAKLDLIRLALQLLYDDVELAWPKIEEFISLIVETANKLEIFNKNTPPVQ